jgi:NADPH oxidase 2
MDHYLVLRIFLTQPLKISEVKNLVLNDGAGGLDAITRLRAVTNFGRPNWAKEFTDVKSRHRGADIGVFYCGPKALSGVLHKCCNEFTGAGPDGTRFFYGKENF